MLRQHIANLTTDPNLRDIPNTLLGSADLKTSHLQAVVTLLNNQQFTQSPLVYFPEQLSELEDYQSKLGTPRSLIVIDAAQNKCICINSNLEVSEMEIRYSLTQMLQNTQPSPVVLLHKAGRWQACIPETHPKKCCVA
ncbi:MAG: hypothetical protein LBD69_02860 [Puniceicoccales bacterium]|jgi:hypothetical protein|nr:hypothetical protein [Puniceicoccales bacterium]